MQMSKFITTHCKNESYLFDLDNVSTVRLYERGGDFWVKVIQRGESAQDLYVYKGKSQADARLVFDQIREALVDAAPSTKESAEFRICDIEDLTPEGYTCVLAFSSRGESFALYRRLS